MHHMYATYSITRLQTYDMINDKWKTVRPKVATFCGVSDNVFRMYSSGDNDEYYLQKTQTKCQVEYGVPFTLLHCWKVLRKCDKWNGVEVQEYISQRDEHKSKNYKSSVASSFSTRNLGEGNFNLNSTTRNEEDEVQEVCPSRLMGRDQAKRKRKVGTLSTSSTISFDVESLAKLTVKEYAMVNDPYNVQNGHNMTKLLQMKLELKVKELEI
ncbi:RNA-directed DNA polymerase, eukaryota [Tanacetum coccineum]